jgi:hypothetical protein
VLRLVAGVSGFEHVPRAGVPLVWIDGHSVG